MTASLAPARGHVLVLSHDVVGRRMAGPGIRYFHLASVLARALAGETGVVLAVPPGSTLADRTDFRVLRYGAADDPLLGAAAAEARAVLVPAIALSSVPGLVASRVPVCVDGYDPFVAETLFLSPGAVSVQQRTLREACSRGDFFVCASERQRDWWLGALDTAGRVNPLNHASDPSFRTLVDLVPYGLPSAPPRRRRDVLRALWPSIGADDRVVLWSGGLWPWLDPLCAVRAMPLVLARRGDVRLVFPGTRHPNPESWSLLTGVEAARSLARELGLLDGRVHFGDWVSYEDWPDVLLGSDVAVTLASGETLESRLAFRSRVLEHVWAGLPTVASRGDVTAELVGRLGVGRVVAPGDPGAVAASLLQVLATPREAWTPAFESAREELTWERAARPLVDFCRRGRPAADREPGAVAEAEAVPAAPAAPLPAEAFRVEWREVTASRQVGAGEPFPVRVRLANLGPVDWPDLATASPSRSGERAVRLAHWLERVPGGPEEGGARRRVDLPAPLGPGEEVSLSFAAVAPWAPGRYLLKLELLQEYVAWFSAMGAPALSVEIDVRAEAPGERWP